MRSGVDRFPIRTPAPSLSTRAVLSFWSRPPADHRYASSQRLHHGPMTGVCDHDGSFRQDPLMGYGSQHLDVGRSRDLARFHRRAGGQYKH